MNHLFEENKSLLSLLQDTVSPCLPQNSHYENSNLNIDSPPVCSNFETPTKNPLQTPTTTEKNRLID